MLLRFVLPLMVLSSFLTAQTAPPTRPPDTSTETQAPLVAEWKTLPRLNGNVVKGSLGVTNQTDDDFDQTVIVEAVNEIGKAFTLGYQHFTLARHASSPVIRFETMLPPGHYVIHADAVAEVPQKHAIHRIHLQAPTPIGVTEI